MPELTPRDLKNTAQLRLATAETIPRKLTALHSGIALGAGVLVALSSLVLNLMIQNTGGLGDLGVRTVLGTMRTTLQLVVQLLMPFWAAGFTCCGIGLARQHAVGPKTLTEGLRRWGVVLRLNLCRGGLLLLLGYLTLQLAYTVFMMTPLADNAIAIVETVMGNGTLPDLTTLPPDTMEQLLTALTPVYVLWAVVFVAVALPILYRFRMADFRIMDRERPGALRAMAQSGLMMRGSRWKLCKLDLSYWWFYGAELGLSLLLYTEFLLGGLGVSLPMDSDLLYLLCYLIYAGATFALHLFFRARVETTYGVFYDRLLQVHKPPVPPQPRPPQY